MFKSLCGENGGKRLERTYTKFREKYFWPGRGNGLVTYEWIEKEGASEKIQNRISDIALAMRAQDYLELPDLVEQDVTVELTKEEGKTYRELEKSQLLQMEETSMENGSCGDWSGTIHFGSAHGES